MSSKSGVRSFAAGAVTVTIASGLMISLSADVADAYAAASGPTEQLKIIRRAFAVGHAVPVMDKNTLTQVAGTFCDKSSRSNSC
jgi:hypothetical protein